MAWGAVMGNYPEGIRQFDNHPSSPFYVDPIDDLAQDIMSGLNEVSVAYCIEQAVKKSSFAKRYEQALQDISLGPSCGYEMNRVVNEAVVMAATKIYEGL